MGMDFPHYGPDHPMAKFLKQADLFLQQYPQAGNPIGNLLQGILHAKFASTEQEALNSISDMTIARVVLSSNLGIDAADLVIETLSALGGKIPTKK